MATIAFGLAFVGCLLLSLSLRRHYRRALTDDYGYEQWVWPLRTAGYAMVLLASWPCVALFGAPIGICLWLSILALAAFLVIMLLTYCPGFLR